jgi:hypothetical protein
MEFLNANHTLATYETKGGELGFLKYDLVTIKEEVPEFASAIVDRELEEALLVAATDAPLVAYLCQTHDHIATLAGLLDGVGVSYRYPAGAPDPRVRSLGFRRSGVSRIQAAA